MHYTSVYIEKCSLKELLSLFNQDSEMVDLSFGDTCSPFSGFIDETFLKGKNKVKDLMSIDYNFTGLIYFEVKIELIKISYISNKAKVGYERYQGDFELAGLSENFEPILNKLMELDPEGNNKYNYTFEIKWHDQS